MPSNLATLIKIAKLYIAIPSKVVKEHLGPKKYHELMECYTQVSHLIEHQGELFKKEKSNVRKSHESS
jgi:hypothetical protein